MPSVGIALNATGESSGGILWPVLPRSHKLFLCSNINLTDHLHMTEAIVQVDNTVETTVIGRECPAIAR